MKRRAKYEAEPDELAGIPDPATANEFESLSEADKLKVTGYYETHSNPKGLRALNKAERALVKSEQDRERRKIGRPVVGEGARQIAVTIEAELLRQVDEYAKSHGIKRTQMIAQGLRKVMTDGDSGGKPRRRKSA